MFLNDIHYIYVAIPPCFRFVWIEEIGAFTLFPTVHYVLTLFRVLTVILDIATKWYIFFVAIATYIIDDWNVSC